MDINLVKIVINGVNLVKIGHFRLKCPTFSHFLGGKNDVICQNLKVVKKIFHSKIRKIIPGGSTWMNLTKKLIKIREKRERETTLEPVC